jgi:hypothetical protein
MIKIEITCLPEEMTEHIRALGLMWNPTHALGVGETDSEFQARQRQIAEDFYAGRGAAKFVGPAWPKDQADSEFRHTLVAHSFMDPNGKFAEPVAKTTNPLADELSALERPEDLKAPTQPEGSTRVPGQPSPGKKRRTKEEVAEDYAYMAKAIPGSSETTVFPAAAISTGEERIDPETEAQDAADEAAETAARKGDEPTINDLRNAALRYQEWFGVKAAVDNMRGIIGCAIAEVKPEGIADAISRVEAAISGLTVIGVPNGKAAEAPATATKEDAYAAAAVYGKKFDGVEDPAQMIITREDVSKLLQRMFGGDAKSFGTMPQSPESFGKAVAAINAAVRDNPFQREARS